MPCTRDLPGVNYPVGTHVGLNKFHDRMRERDALRGTDVDLNAPQLATTHTRKIFRENAGSVPGYTGVVPGYKYKHGRTYGHATTGAKPSFPVLVGDDDDEDRMAGDTSGGGRGKGSASVKAGEGKRLWQKGDDPYCVEVILDSVHPDSGLAWPRRKTQPEQMVEKL